MPTHPLDLLRTGAVIALLASFAACTEEPVREPLDTGLTLGGDIYRILCKRVASTVTADDLTGTQFNDPCEGKVAPTGSEAPKLKAMLEMRGSLVQALDLALGEMGDPAQSIPEVFAEGELTGFLELMVPLYDPPTETLPAATRAAAEVIRTWVDPTNADSAAAIQALAGLSGREGFRPLTRALGPLRTLLDYERLDQVTTSTLKLLDTDGAAHEPFVRSLTALGLELATLGDDDDNEPGPTGLEVAIDLLTRTDARLASADGALPVLKRDARGLPVPSAGLAMMGADGPQVDEASHRILGANGQPLPTPYRLSLTAEPAIPADTAPARDAFGRALTAPAEQGGQPVYDSWDMDQSLLAAVLRDSGDLIKRDGEPRSAIENITRALRVQLGPNTARTEAFGPRNLQFTGPDPNASPLLDLMHAVGTLLTFEETAQGLKMLRWLLENHENEAAQILHAALKIDEISDDPMYDGAQLMGRNPDGSFSPDAPHDFWDDMIQVVRDIDSRPGMLDAVLRVFADPLGPASVKLIANWMRYNNMVVYGGAPEDSRVNAPANADALKQNTINNAGTILDGFEPGTSPTVAMYSSTIDPSLPNREWNRSLWQRTLSLIHGLNGVEVCNKQDAYMKASALLNLGLSPPQGEGPYAECDFIYIQDAVQQYNQALLGEAQIVFQPSDSADWVNTWAALGSGLGISGTVGQEQEKDSGIYGFTDTPTAESLARFIFAPRNDFLKALFDPLKTIDGVAINEWEPYGLFPMEIVDPTAQAGDGSTPNGTSFIQSSGPLTAAFEHHELKDSNDLLTDGYMFGKMLSKVHMHWGAPGLDPCEAPPNGWGCTQSVDPEAPFYAYGTNVRSYEQLIANALLAEGEGGVAGLADALYANTKALTEYTDDETGEDGITVLLKLVRALTTPRESVQYRKASITSSFTNTGKDLGEIVPIYLVLDALKAMDDAWAKSENSERHDAWLLGRSKLVDIFLAASKLDDGSGNVTYQMTNRRVPPVAKILVDWLLDRIDYHTQQGDLETWGPDLTNDVEDVLSHPATAAGLDMLDVFWNDQTASDEVSALLTYMLGDPQRETFAAMLETALHAAQFMRDEDRADALARGLALLLEPSAQSKNAQEPPQAADSASMKGITVLVALVESDLAQAQMTGRARTTGNKILRDIVAALEGDGRSPLEVFIDSVFRIHRTNPSLPAYGVFSQDDVRSILTEAADFLDDDQHGLERLTQVIQHRQLGDGSGDQAAAGTTAGGAGATAGTGGGTGATAGTGGTAGATAGTTAGTAGTNAGTGTTTDGTTGATGGMTAGTGGMTAGATGGTGGDTAGTNGATAGATGGTAGATAGSDAGTDAGSTGTDAGSTGTDAGTTSP